MQKFLSGKPSAVALGSFDGLHKGHMAVINTALSYKAKGLIPCVLLFDVHPQQILSGKAPMAILPPSLRKRKLEKLGILCFPVAFEDVRTMAPEEFVRHILVDKMNAQAICCGYDYRFGYHGTGDVSSLKELCSDLSIDLKVAAVVEYEGEPISSTRIRGAIEQGNIQSANAMLGRAFSYDYEVVGGDRVGRLLGAPTINQLFPEGFVIPKFGVYAAKAFVENAWHAAVTNIGRRPTFDSNVLRSETCILDFSGDLYGQNIEVGLLQYLRGEQKFNSLEELSNQIQCDAQLAKGIFNNSDSY